MMLQLIGLAGALGCGDVPSLEPTTQAEQGIVGGQVDDEHRNVFILLANLGRAFSSCTATLIAPNLLLTARHCVSTSEDEDEVVVCGRSDLGQTYTADRLRASNALDVRDSTRWYRGASVHVPEEGSDTCGYDVALVVLTENVPASVAVPAIPRIDREVTHGEPYIAVGYGEDERGEQGGRQSLDGLTVACAPGQCGRVAPNGEFVGDTGVCQGDSGGPAFDTDGKLVGIVSRGAEDCSLPVYGTVTTWSDLIRRVAVQAALRGKYDTPFWVTQGVSDPIGPSPGVGCLSEQDCRAGSACKPVSEGSPSTCSPVIPVPGDGSEPEATCSYTVATDPPSVPVALLGLLSGLSWLRRRRPRDSSPG